MTHRVPGAGVCRRGPGRRAKGSGLGRRNPRSAMLEVGLLAVAGAVRYVFVPLLSPEQFN